MAIENGHDDLVKFLITQDALFSTDESGRTPLFVAIKTGNIVAAILLVSAGADVNSRDSHGWTAAFTVIKNNGLDMGHHLGKITDPNIMLPDGRTFLHVAAQTGNGRLVQKLLALY